ncbi:hypothetical protein ACFOZ7_21565 [Natribaculum luteum]|uniref:Uncharacterized protein n=1 Tax=Natribaculum luteum TaxID=1586232 RepID=A0ABD5P583_9EURY|nr:hypothetical protein [Natribaculum luteum]
MQFKLVPEAPEDLESVAAVQQAVPLIPANEDDCCARIMRRTEIAPRDEARTWLTFLRALGLAEEGSSGFTRTQRDPDPEDLRRTVREQIYGVEDVLETLEAADGPLAADEVYERFREKIPQYEQYRYGDRVDEIWRERVERILEWAVVLDLAERSESGYRRERTAA